ncbi:Carb anhydrase [Geosmithia morbida]|uniref:carbonic anhydrase n=1 Tax=Geosmithia morbida TaxID=1094350 RepID=A0A9P5D0Q0_9HYPO|nr:Carb anhydrase [Geosmithia morbida]KAF4121862.1 Carb anhydrase [Geosmithia morbida]
MTRTATYLSLGFLATFAPGALASCAYGTHLHRRADGEIEAPTFGYIGDQGPTNWHALDAANSACAQGTEQSPINMVADAFTLQAASELNITIPDMADGAEFENLGTTVEVIAQGGTMTAAGVQYTLQQFHFHLPSEHLDDGTTMAMEMHMVWESADEQIAVVGVYIDLATGTEEAVEEEAPATEEPEVEEPEAEAPAATTTAAPVGVARPATTLTPKTEPTAAARVRRGDHRNARRERAQREQAKREQAKRADVRRRQAKAKAQRRQAGAGGASAVVETVLGVVDQIPNLGDTVTTDPLIMSELVNLIGAADVQTYSGSLTTPPCSESVSWFVSTQKLSIQTSTFIKARDVIGFNSRFPQSALGTQNVLATSAAAVAAGAEAEAEDEATDEDED